MACIIVLYNCFCFVTFNALQFNFIYVCILNYNSFHIYIIYTHSLRTDSSHNEHFVDLLNMLSCRSENKGINGRVRLTTNLLQ